VALDVSDRSGDGRAVFPPPVARLSAGSARRVKRSDRRAAVRVRQLRPEGLTQRRWVGPIPVGPFVLFPEVVPVAARTRSRRPTRTATTRSSRSAREEYPPKASSPLPPRRCTQTEMQPGGRYWSVRRSVRRGRSRRSEPHERPDFSGLREVPDREDTRKPEAQPQEQRHRPRDFRHPRAWALRSTA
jgi:hypothetical protein